MGVCRGGWGPVQTCIRHTSWYRPTGTETILRLYKARLSYRQRKGPRMRWRERGGTGRGDLTLEGGCRRFARSSFFQWAARWTVGHKVWGGQPPHHRPSQRHSHPDHPRPIPPPPPRLIRTSCCPSKTPPPSARNPQFAPRPAVVVPPPHLPPVPRSPRTERLAP